MAFRQGGSAGVAPGRSDRETESRREIVAANLALDHYNALAGAESD
jgi:hypothetical protein